MQLNEVKGCPFCGGAIGSLNVEIDSVMYRSGYRLGLYKGVFTCAYCESEIHITGDSHEDLLKKWNELPRKKEETMNNAFDWKYIDKDGNPEKEGVYWVVLLYENFGKTIAEVDTRYFGEAEKNEGWIMEGQPDTGLVWTEETGSYEGERVWAWAEIGRPQFPERLPENVVIAGEE